MKKSEFVSQETNRIFELEGWSFLLPEHHKLVDLMVQQRTEVVERAGVIWDPEEPEVLWEGEATETEWPQRILSNGRCEYECITDEGKQWTPSDSPALAELARRLLAERANKAKQDVVQHNLTAGLAANRDHVTDGSPCWCNPVTEKPGIEGLPKGDSAAVTETAAWIEEEGKSRDLGGEVRSAEIRPHLARISRVGDPSWWYAKYVSKVFEVERIRADGVVVHWPPRACTYIVELEDVEYLEFLDLDS